MTREEVVKWLESLKREIGKAENRTLWHYAESIDMAIKALKGVDGDLIRREDAIEALLKAFSDSETVRVESEAYWHHGTVLSILKSLPSTICEDCIWHVCNYNKIDWEGEDGYISRRDVVNEIHKYFVEEIDKTPTEIDEDGDELYADMPTVNSLLACNKELSKRIKSLPSAEPPYQYSEAYVNQLRGERDILQDMVDNMAEPKTGEWIQDDDYICDQCGCFGSGAWDFCPHCGAKMYKDGEDE